jgi:hypothetical protein
MDAPVAFPGDVLVQFPEKSAFPLLEVTGNVTLTPIDFYPLLATLNPRGRFHQYFAQARGSSP